jgi:hypothetical protein
MRPLSSSIMFQVNSQSSLARRPWTLQARLGHRNIQRTVRYTALAADGSKNFWRR